MRIFNHHTNHLQWIVLKASGAAAPCFTLTRTVSPWMRSSDEVALSYAAYNSSLDFLLASAAAELADLIALDASALALELALAAKLEALAVGPVAIPSLCLTRSV